METYIDPQKLRIWVHTWWKRDGVRDATIDSILSSDVKKRFSVERQDENISAVDFYLKTMRRLCADPECEWILRLEDDTVVNKFLMYNVCTWDVPHVEKDFGIGFLSVTDPVMSDTRHLGYGAITGCPYRKYHEMHFGGGMLFRASTLATKLDDIEAQIRKPRKSIAFSCAPSKIMHDHGLHSYFHIPSIVKVDLDIPCSKLGRVYMPNSIAAFGSQPFSANWKR